MSIANNSLLRRILVEVDSAPSPGGFGATERILAADQLLELRRSQEVHQAPFATSMHFWAHALRAFLEDFERPDLFEALAANCLCEAADDPVIAANFERLGQRTTPPLEIERNSGYTIGYRMIDQAVLISWVAERSEEYVAIFWARRGWLASAQPLEFD